MRPNGSHPPIALAWIGRTLEAAGVISDISPRIVNYHSIGVSGGYDSIPLETFQDHVRWLTDRYDVVSLDRLFEGQNGRKRIAITFDDGLTSFYRHALPVLRQYDAPATVFVIGAVADETTADELELIRTERLGTSESFMDLDQLATLVEEPLVTIGAHSMTHQELPMLTPDRLTHEVVDSRDVLESALGVEVTQFSYPYNFWNDAVHRVVADAFDYAVHGWGMQSLISELTDRHLLPRINGGTTLASLRYSVRDFSTLVSLGVKSSHGVYEPTRSGRMVVQGSGTSG